MVNVGNDGDIAKRAGHERTRMRGSVETVRAGIQQRRSEEIGAVLA
jgi:hypothetical protein